MTTTNWQERHFQAFTNPRGPEKPIVGMISAWIDYGEQYEKRFESKLGEDYILGKAWKEIGFALLEMLNGDLGRLDGGSLDELLRGTLRYHEFNPDE